MMTRTDAAASRTIAIAFGASSTQARAVRLFGLILLSVLMLTVARTPVL